MKIFKGIKLYSIITGACPVCHHESMYSFKNPYNLSKVISMNEYCSHCHTKYQMEPSFFFGAMFVSYGLGVGLGISAFLIAHYILKIGLVGAFLFIVACIITLSPIIIRLSRNIWINLFLSFDSKKAKLTSVQNE